MSKFEYECNLDAVMLQVFRIRDGLEILDEITDDLHSNAKSLINMLLQVAEATTELAGKSVEYFPPVE